MVLTHSDLEMLTWTILDKFKEEFAIKHLSMNLVNTIEVHNNPDGIQIVIPAKTYNMLLYQTQGVVVHTSHGSYASKLDKEGSQFYVYPNGARKGSKKIKPGNHKGYVDRVINEAINEWMVKLGKFDSKKITDFGG